MATKHTLEVLGKVIALAAFVFTVSTYAYNQYLKRKQEQYESSLASIDQYTKSGVREKEIKIDLRLLYYTSQVNINDKNEFPDDLFEVVALETLFGYYENAGETAQDTSALLPDFIEIMDFYARVSFCLESRICDGRIVRAFFCPRAASLLSRHARMIEFYNGYNGSEELSDGIRSFDKSCQAAG